MAGHDKITKEGKKFFSDIEQLKRLQVRVGFQRGEETEDDGTDLVDIALWNELGTTSGSHIPPRPFLRKSADENADEISSFCKNQVKRITRGQATAQEVLTSIGVKQKSLVQKKIKDGEFIPNSNVTKLLKGSPNVVKKRKALVKQLTDTGISKSDAIGRVTESEKFTPLIDTSHMRQSVGFVIKEKE